MTAPTNVRMFVELRSLTRFTVLTPEAGQPHGVYVKLGLAAYSETTGHRYAGIQRFTLVVVQPDITPPDTVLPAPRVYAWIQRLHEETVLRALAIDPPPRLTIDELWAACESEILILLRSRHQLNCALEALARSQLVMWLASHQAPTYRITGYGLLRVAAEHPIPRRRAAISSWRPVPKG